MMQPTTPTDAPNDPQPSITAYWDERGRSYDGANAGGLDSPELRDAWIEDLRDLLPSPPMPVVDVGTGTGFLAILLSDLGYAVAGYDVSEGMMAQARAKVAGRPNAPTFEVGDAHDPPVPPSSADLLTCRYLMWTLPDPARALAAWKRALKPDGRLLVVDGLWYAGREAPSDENIEEHLKDLPPLYRDAAVQAQLPLMLTESVIPMIQVIEGAGFDVLTLQRLLRVEDVDRRLRPEQYGRQPRYAIVARPKVGV